MIYEILGKPIPLQRHRHGKGFSYDPQKKEKEVIQWKIKEYIEKNHPFCGPLFMEIEYHMPIPESYSKKKRGSLEFTPHYKKPDLSNLLKFTEDALNGIVWKDDSMISYIKAKKIYSFIPKTVFKIKELYKSHDKQ